MNAESVDARTAELFRHRSWMQRLAQGLLADPAAADDVVQETWLAALRRPPRAAESVRAWLGRVARNAALQLGRSEGARRLREAGSARRETLPSAAAVSERASCHRELVDAVLALEEPYRSAILYRYFEELPAAEVARRLGVPSSTVRNRVKRALERLRADLRRKHGEGWSALCLGLAGLVPGGRGAVALGSKWIWAASIGLGVAAAVLVWPSRLADPAPDHGGAGPPDAAAPAAGYSAHAPAPPAGVGPGGDPPAESARVAVGPRRPAPAEPADVLLYGAVTDLGGTPLGRGLVCLEHELGEAAVDELRDRPGYAFPGLPPGRWRLQVEAPGRRSQDHVLELAEDQPFRRLDLALEPAEALAIRLRLEGGGSLAALLREARVGYRARPAVIATTDPPGDRLRLAVGERAEILGVGRWTHQDVQAAPEIAGLPPDCDGRLELDRPLPLHVSVTLRERVLATRLVAPGTEELLFELDPEAVAASFAELRGRLVDAETGLPLVDAEVEVEPDSARARTDAHGRFRIESLLPGPAILAVQAEGHERRERAVALWAGLVRNVGELTLHETTALRGRVVDPQGRPVATAVHLSPAERDDRHLRPVGSQVVRSDPDGVLVLSTVGRRDLLLWVQNDEWCAPPIRFDARSGLPVRLEVRPSTAVVLRHPFGDGRRGTVVLADGAGTPFWSATTRSTRPLRVGLAPGRYALQVLEDGRELERRTIEVGSETLLVHVGG